MKPGGGQAAAGRPCSFANGPYDTLISTFTSCVMALPVTCMTGEPSGRAKRRCATTEKAAFHDLGSWGVFGLQPWVPLRGRRTGVKMAGGTARDVVVSLVR